MEAILTTQSINILLIIKHETSRRLKLRQEISNLQNEFESLQGFLGDAEKRKEEDETVRKWMSSVKDLAYEAQEITKKHLKLIERHRRRTQGSGRCNFSCNPWHSVLSLIDAMILDRDASRIYSLTNKISALTSKMKAYGIEFTPLVDPPPATTVGSVDLAAEEDKSVIIVGLDDDVKEIENQLICTGGDKVIGVCGTNGLGKTTLVKEVLRRSPLVREHFDEIFWVYLGSEFQAEDVLKNVFLHLLGKFGVTDDERNAVAGLKQILIEKRCLLIFDDLARTDDTLRAKRRFLDKASELYLIASVLVCSCADSSPSEGGNDRPTTESSLFGRQDDEIGVDKVLELTYKALPRRLRLCLAEMSNHWPEGDGKISSEELFKVWVDKQIVKRRRRSSEEEVAEGYLNELVKRSLVQVVEKDRATGKTRTCQLHSLVRDFYRRISNGSSHETGS